MKRNIIVSVILVSVFASCITEKSSKILQTRTIKNSSSYLVDLTITASENYQIRLAPRDSVVFEGEVEIGGGTDFSDLGWSNFKPVSGKIVFDNKRELVYEDGSCENGRNPLNRNIWQLHSCGYYNEDTNGDGLSEYIYEISDTDYEMAVPIEK